MNFKIAAPVLTGIAFISILASMAGPLQPQATAKNLTVKAVVTDSSGAPWTSQVRLLVRVESTQDRGVTLRKTQATPSTKGHVAFIFPMAQTLLDGSSVTLKVLANPALFSIDSNSDFFLKASAGDACIHKPMKPSFIPSTGDYLANFKASAISSPPLYGTMALGSSNGQQLTMKVVDFHPNGALGAGHTYSVKNKKVLPPRSNFRPHLSVEYSHLLRTVYLGTKRIPGGKCNSE